MQSPGLLFSQNAAGKFPFGSTGLLDALADTARRGHYELWTQLPHPPTTYRPCRRAPTPPEVREQRERERELMELDRDIRTIFAYNLPLKASEKELFQFFSSAGQIADVRIIVDRNTRKSKGFAYIEYANRVSRFLRAHEDANPRTPA